MRDQSPFRCPLETSKLQRRSFNTLFNIITILFVTTSFSPAQNWKEVYNPMIVRSLYLEVDPADWTRVINDQPIGGDTASQERAAAWFSEAPISSSFDAALPPPTDSILVEIRRKGASDPVLTAGGLTKVSLKIDINELVGGQRWEGLRKLSLEIGGEGGPLAEGFAWQVNRLAGEAGFYKIDTANAAWVKLYVNGNFHGVYTSTEQRDEQFLRNRDLYSESNTWLYKVDEGTFLEVGIGDSPAREHLLFPPFQTQETAPDLESDLPQWIDMDVMLMLAAANAYTENNDGIFKNDGKNSFAIDFDPPNERRRIYLPWDLDAGFKQGRSDIYGRFFDNDILDVAWFRRIYEHTLRELIDGPWSQTSLHAFLNDLEVVLASELANDPFISAGAGSFSSMRSWVTTRNANVLGQLLLPYVPRPEFNHPGGEVISGFNLTMTAPSGQIYYTTDGSDPRLSGGAISSTATLYSTPVLIDQNTRIVARTLDAGNWSGLASEINLQLAVNLSPIRVSEIMYHPSDPNPGDTIDDNEYEFIELYNTGLTTVDLTGHYFDGITYTFPAGATIPAGGYLVLARNATAFSTRYPSVTPDGEYLSGLSNGGEKIRLRTPNGTTLISVEYDDDPNWTLSPDGLGYSLTNRNLNGDPDDPANWSASSTLLGTPGGPDTVPPYSTGLVLNEVITNTTAPYEDAMEIFNPSGSPIDISGWFLSDEARDLSSALTPSLLKKYKLPPGSVVPANGFLVIYQGEFDTGNPLAPFQLDLHGGRIYLSSADPSENLTGEILALEFPAMETNVSYGRVFTSDGPREALLSTPSFGISPPVDVLDFRTGTGATNTSALVGPVVLSEIMYNPVETDSEFVELHNISGSAVDITGWDIDGISGFSFPASTSIEAGSFIVLIDLAKTDVTTFRSNYSVPAGVPIFGALFDLGNAGESLRLEKPNPVVGQPDILVEKVRYNDKAPWATEADGAGPSLERLPPNRFGNEPLHWRADTVHGTPGQLGFASGGLPIAKNSFWDALATAGSLDPSWNTQSYNATAWSSVDGPSGYGEPFLKGIVSFGPDASDRYPTTYFRKPFVLTDSPTNFADLSLEVLYDDGVIVYLNGTEVARRELPTGPVLYGTYASTDREATVYELIDLSAYSYLLTQGTNIIAAEVHQSGPTSSDLVWDAELSYSLILDPNDVDGDGLPKAWETANGLDDNNPTDALIDSDGDGQNNTAEFIAGTNPQDANSYLSIKTLSYSPGSSVTLTWDSVPGKSYIVSYSQNLQQWFTFGVASELTATETETQFDDPTTPPSDRYYRIEALP